MIKDIMKTRVTTHIFNKQEQQKDDKDKDNNNGDGDDDDNQPPPNTIIITPSKDKQGLNQVRCDSPEPMVFFCFLFFTK